MVADVASGGDSGVSGPTAGVRDGSAGAVFTGEDEVGGTGGGVTSGVPELHADTINNNKPIIHQ